MKDYFILHEVSLFKEDSGIKHLFGLNQNFAVAIEQIETEFERSKKNSRQVLVDTQCNSFAEMFVKFKTPLDAFEQTQMFIVEELDLELVEGEHSLFKEKNKEIAFKVYSQNKPDAGFDFRGLIFATTANIKPKIYVALESRIERDYDKEIYNKY